MLAPIRYFNAYVLFPFLEKQSKRSITPKLRELQNFEKLGREQQLQLQREALHRILVHAKAHIPYYTDLFKKLSFDESKVLEDIRYVQKLPILTKTMVRENIDRIKLPAAHHARKTGGSTGQSVFFYYDDAGLDWSAAINLMAYEMAGNLPHKGDAHIGSELGIEEPPLKYKLLDRLKLFAQNRSRLMINSFSDEDLAASFAQLKSIKPFLLQGHPSSGYAIANYIKEKNLPLKTYCSVFEPSGEMLTSKMVETMEKYLGCRVANRYGNAEFGVMAHTRIQDPYNELKVFDRAFYIEDAYKSDLIVSGFTNFSMPLIRYQTGDIATVKSEAKGTFISDLQGRVHDAVVIDGRPYMSHYIMDYLDHKIRGIREFQILSSNQSTPLINIVPENEADAGRIESMLKERWPKGLDVGFVRYEELRKVGWQQKFRHVIDLSSRT